MLRLGSVDKASLIETILRELREDLEKVTESQKKAQEGATHEEAKAEGDKDMRATETSYVARGLAQRVTSLRESIGALTHCHPRSFSDGPIAATALARLEDEEGTAKTYFVLPAGGGQTLEWEGERIYVITPNSPLGRAVAGLCLNEEAELEGGGKSRFLTLVAVG